MTLYELLNSTTVQGAIRLSAWVRDEERILWSTEWTDDFGIGDIEEEWEDCRVLYMFCPGDGYLHIEIEMEEE